MAGLPTVASVLALLCLLTIANASPIAPSSITSNLCDFEDLPETLPSNLSSIAYLGLNGEFHIHGEFFANYSTHEHNTFFSLPTESYFRISVAPQQDWDVDLFLYSSEQSSPIASAVAFYGEEMITRVLPAGDYRLRFNFLIFSFMTENIGKKCKTLTLEWSIVPKTKAKERASKFTCGAKEVLPELPKPFIVKDAYSFNSTQTFNVQTNQPSTKPTDIRMVKDYSISIPSPSEKIQMWRIDAVLGYDFLTGGSLGLLLDFNATTVEKDLSCVSRTKGLLRPNADECTVAVDARINEAVLSWIVEPGDYTLWIYELYNQTDKSVLGCTPFTFSLSLTPFQFNEDLLNCKAARLPTTLNVPGLLGDRGVLEFAEDVWLDYEHPDNAITFNLTTTSNLRVYVEEHHVDIDLRLSNASGYLAQSITFGREEAIIMTLSPGTYTLSIKYFDAREPQFCDTFFLMIGIAPLSLVPSGLCSGAALPSAPTLPDTNAFARPVSVPSQSYRYVWPNESRSTTNIFTHYFTPTDAVVRIVVGVDFLLGDMKLVMSWNDITSDGKTTVRELIGVHAHGMIYLSAQLPAKQVQLTLSTGYTVQRNLKLPSFPPCITYTFQMDYYPLESPEYSNFCSDYVPLPFAINTTQALGLKEIHLSDRFIMPHKEGVLGLVTEKSAFTVKEASQFRLFCEAPDVDNNVDVDFHLSENNQIVASAIGTKQEEEITYTLLPGKSYELTVYFFLPYTGGTKCMSYSLELSIAPVDTKTTTCNGQADNLPPANLVPSPPGKYFESVKTYSFTQTDKALRHHINFTLDQPYFLRAIISYDFLWNNLNLRLRHVNPSATTGNLLAYGKTAYNRNDIDVVQLNEGQYVLEVYEPSLLNNANARGCVKFDLLVALLPVTPSADSPVLSRCWDWPLPESVNNIAGLSVLSDSTMHWQRDVLANVRSKEEYMAFNLDTPSVFRIYIPHHTLLDVDLYLYDGTPGHPGAEQIDAKTSFGEESIAYKLPAGPHFLKTKLYPQRQISLPSASDCAFFPAEVAIAPLVSLTNNPAVGQTCTNMPLPAALTPNTEVAGTYRYARTATQFQHKIALNVTSNSELMLDLKYDFITSAVSARLTRRESATASGETFYSRIGTNHAFLNAALVPGTYELVIHDPVPDFKINELKCLTFEMTYTFLTDGVPDEDFGCDSSQLLPSNLDAANGGSVPFGGPQAADGEIKIFADHVLIPKERFTVKRVEFVNPQDSYLRLFAHSDNTNNDVDFTIYSNTNKTAGSLIGFSNSMQSIESSLFFIPASTNKHLLEVTYFRIDESKPCNYFHFGLASKPRSKVLQDLLCPINVNSPPVDLTFAAGNDVDVHSDDYVFNAALINSTQRTFRYSTQLNVRDKTTFSAEIGFNFLANDFRLALRDANNVVIHTSKVRGTSNSNSYINFYHYLRAELQPGTYHMDIVEDLLKTELKLNSSQCHRFSLSVSGISESTPHILSVSPPEGRNLDPSKDLNLRITFSDPVVEPRDVAAYLATHNPPDRAPGLALRHVATGRPTLRGAGEWEWIRPASVRLDGTRRILEVVFAHGDLRSEDGAFELLFNLTDFTTTNGVHFANAAQQGRVYSLVNLNCSDHGRGTAGPNGTVICQCDMGYAGVNCDSCAQGFHSVGNKCAANLPCTPESCNGHGSCNDQLGYPICTCFQGYATVGTNSCSVCAQGYEGYPQCAPIPESSDSSTRCSAQLLPRHLDTVAHLGYNDEVRLQGYFYIDVAHQEHSMYFKLAEDSLFRIYAQPHWVDIDLWLYRIGKTKTETIANGGLSIGKEESLSLRLNKTLSDDSYLLKFRYFVFSSSRPACETVNIDLAIAPESRVYTRVQSKKQTCTHVLHNVSTALPLADQTIIQVSSDSGGYNYAPNHKFAVAPPNKPAETRPFKDRGYYFWNKSISLSKVPDNHVAILRVEVGYSFLESDFALLLELGSNTPDHCTGSQDSHKSCIYGFNTYNKNILEAVIQPNAYTLWLYQPEQMYGECALFEFSLSVRFEVDDSKTFVCEGPTLPPSLNGVNYINPQTGYLHLAEDYVVDFVQYTYFEVKTPTYFKAAAKPKGNWWGFALSLFSENDTDYYVIADDSIFRQLAPGNYSIFISAFSLEDDQYCPEVRLELELIPKLLWDTMLSEQSNDPCPFPARSVLPMLPSPLTGLEYTYAGDTLLYAFGTGDVKSYTIEVSQQTRVIASIESNFIMDDVRLELRSTGGLAVVKSQSDYNRAVLDHVLESGTYFLVITRPTFDGAPARPYQCSPFDFALSVLPYGVSSREQRNALAQEQQQTPTTIADMEHMKWQVDTGVVSLAQLNEQLPPPQQEKRDDPAALSLSPCVGVAFEQIPATLNSKRFLYSDPVINYQSDNFLVPLDGAILTEREILIIAKEESILRIYTEFFRQVDIDLKLYMANGTNQDYTLVTSASNGIYNEEVIVAKLFPRIPQAPGSSATLPVRYKLKIIFWKWNLADLPKCATFNMELAITPVSMIGAGSAACPDGGDKWPADFPGNLPAKPYHYDSTDPVGLHDGVAELLYITQTATPKSKTYTFQLGPEITDLHLDVGYNFGLGDMAMTLTHKESGDKYRGVNGYNRNYITQTNLMPGEYELKIYEPAANHLDYLKCSYFTFEAHIVQGGKGKLINPEQPTLPAVLDLNGVPYLFYEGYTHFQGETTLFEADENVAAKNIKFKVDVPSVLRTASYLTTTDAIENDISFRLSKGYAPVASGDGNLYYTELQPGNDYNLAVMRSEAAPAGDLAQHFELAVEPVAYLDSYVEKKALPLSRCQPFGDGFFNISADRLFTFQKNLTINSHEVDPNKPQVEVAKLRFTVTVKSVVVARVGFQYTLNELRLSLVNNMTNSEEAFVVTSRPYKNFNELDLVVEPGSYTVVVDLIKPSLVWSKLAAKGHRCVPYTLSVVVDDVTRGGSRTDCSQYHVVPLNLDNAGGGSTPFGGPMKNGYVHISSDRFLASGLTGTATATNTMAFTLDTTSMISLITTTPDDGVFEIQYRLYNKRSRTYVEPSHATHTMHSRTELFVVDVTRRTEFELQLTYKKSTYFRLNTCPTFAMDLVIDRYSHVVDNLQCPNMAGIAPSPKTTLTLGASGATVTDFVSTNISTAFLLAHTTGSKFSYPISISVAGAAFMNANLGYSSISNAFTMKIKRVGSEVVLGKSSYVMVPQRSGQTNVVQYLTGNLRAGDYELTIEQPYLPLLQEPSRCYPFVWDILLRSADVTNVIESVEPASGVQLNPQQDLNIRITFTDVPYKGGKKVQLNNPNAIREAFFLMGVSSGAESPVLPTYAELRSSDGTSWLLVFAAGSLQASKTYNLGLVPNALEDSRGMGVVISGREYSYSFLSATCSNHGLYLGGVCLCHVGYAGNDCEHCAQGFYLDGNKCVQNATASNCKLDSCGCRQRDTDRTCLEALGECRDLKNGSIQCFCFDQFHATGPRCEQCLPGYIGYPKCQRRDKCSPTCSANAISCDVEKNKCICPANWAGPTCSKCATGYSGSDCKATAPDASGWDTFFKMFGIVVGVLIGVSAIGWLVWWRYKIWRSRRPRKYLPLGLEELEGATELRGAGDGGDYDDDAFADDPMFSSSPHSSRAASGELAFESHPDEESHAAGQTDSNTNGDDDDFNPRSSDDDRTSSPAASSPSLLDL